VIAIAEKITRMEVLGRFIRPWVHKNNSVLFDKKNRSHYFYIEYNKKFKTAVVAILSKNL
jgi:hypothetical protein